MRPLVRALIVLALSGGALAACASDDQAPPPVDSEQDSESSPPADTEAGGASEDLWVAAKLACAEADWAAPGQPVDLLSAAAMSVADRSGLAFGDVFEAASSYCSDLLDPPEVADSNQPPECDNLAEELASIRRQTAELHREIDDLRPLWQDLGGSDMIESSAWQRSNPLQREMGELAGYRSQLEQLCR